MVEIERGPAGPQGSDLNVLHTERDMTVYVLTESDLDRVGDLGFLAAGFTSAATFFGGLWIDLYKDSKLATQIPDATQQALDFVEPLLGILTIAFAIAALVFWVKRGNLQSRIKRGSRTKKRLTGEIRQTLAGDDAGQSA
jgi:hypothetical protein